MTTYTSPPATLAKQGKILTVLTIVCLISRAAPLSVFVSIAPQHEFVTRIGGNRVATSVLVGPGQSPATYSLSPRQMAMLSRADVLFTIGVPFEKVLVPKIKRSIPGLTIIDTAKGIKRRKMVAHVHEEEPQSRGEHAEHHDGDRREDHGEHAGHDGKEGHEKPDSAEHAPDCEHAHEGDDPHTWLSPLLVVEQSRVIAEALIALDPEGRAIYEASLAKYQGELHELDCQLRETLAPVRGKTLMAFHPSFGYLADAYGLKQFPIEVEGKSPTARQLGVLIQRARRENVKVIFVQKQFSGKAASAIAASIGGAVVAIDPLARDYIDSLKRMTDTIREGLVTQR